MKVKLPKNLNFFNPAEVSLYLISRYYANHQGVFIANEKLLLDILSIKKSSRNEQYKQFVEALNNIPFQAEKDIYYFQVDDLDGNYFTLLDYEIERLLLFKNIKIISVFCYIKSCMNTKSFIAFPSIDTISEKTGISRPLVINILDELVKVGILYIEKISSDKGSKNMYYFLMQSKGKYFFSKDIRYINSDDDITIAICNNVTGEVNHI